jgi:ATP-binding cassette, subfamily B, bacterial
VQSFAKYTSRLGKATAAAERVVEVLDHIPEISDREDAVIAPAFRGDVVFDHVSFHYADRRAVLRDASFTIAAGEFVAIVGESGAGKSTLSNLLLRLYEPASGRVRIDGIDVRDVTIASLRSQVGVVLQDTILFAGTIRDNLSLGITTTDSAIDAALRLANAHDFVYAMPNGLDAVVGERGVTLSNGQRQRLAIARAVLRDTPMLLLDEPTASLDAENEAIVSDAILRMAMGRTTFLITHALHLAARADRVLVLADGMIAENGSPAELLAAGGAFADWCGNRAVLLPTTTLRPRMSHALAG